MTLFLARRLHGFALIADGIGHIFNLRLGLGLRSAKRIASIRYSITADDDFAEMSAREAGSRWAEEETHGY